jgi:hypothetical protein
MDEAEKPTKDQVAQFKVILEDVADFGTKLRDHCSSVDELIDLAKQGSRNDAITRLLLEQMKGKKR